MDYEKERMEAIVAGERALDSLLDARDLLSSARNWGILDILGGGFLSSMIKHSKIDKARYCIERARDDLRDFNRELKDISRYLDFEIEIGSFLTFFDFMDNTFIDLVVQSRIADARRRIEEALDKVKTILRELKTQG